MTARSLLFLAAFASVAAPTARSGSVCGSYGSFGMPAITASSDLLDSRCDFTIADARPGAPWIWLADTSPGPTLLPEGKLCLGPNPIVVASAFSGALPVIGPNQSVSFTLDLPVALAAYVGTTYYMQAVVLDPVAATGYAFSNQLAFVPTAPRAFVVSNAGNQRAIDVVDTIAFAAGSPSAVIDTIAGEGHGDFAVRRDGTHLFLRNVTPSTMNAVRAYDLRTVPATFAGELLVSATPVGAARQGIVLSSDDRVGYFVDSFGKVRRFDADWLSPTFLTLTGEATSTIVGPDGLAISIDDARLFVVGVSDGNPTPSVLSVIDAQTMTEIATVALTDNTPFFGFAFRSALALSPDGRLAATIQRGVFAGSSSGGAAVNVVDVDPQSPTYLTEIAYAPLPRFGQNDVCFAPAAPGFDRVFTVDADATGRVYLSAVQWTTGQVTSKLLAAGAIGSEEGGVATTQNGNLILVGTAADDRLRVFDAQPSLLHSARLPTPGFPGRVRTERRQGP